MKVMIGKFYTTERKNTKLGTNIIFTLAVRTDFNKNVLKIKRKKKVVIKNEKSAITIRSKKHC